jgi:hypothetical protein
MIERVISGGQSGADQAGWRAAKRAGIATGGWMVDGFMTEDGHRPALADLYGAVLLPGVDHLSTVRAMYRRRAEANVRDSDATICFDAARSSASANAHDDALKHGKPFRCVMLDRGPAGLGISPAAHTPRNIAQWIDEKGVRVLNVCGNRESKAPGIGAWVERYLAEVFRLLRAQRD